MEKKDWYIVPECYIDTNITEFLLDSHGVNHQKGCNAVAKIMIERLKDQFSIGIIDNDKTQHSYVNEFTEIAHTRHITLLKHRERPHYFIRISPAMDQFILDCAIEQGINPHDYGLPSTLNEFIQITKDVKAKNDYRFKNLFAAIENSSEMLLFHSILQYLNESKYGCEINALKDLFETETDT